MKYTEAGGPKEKSVSGKEGADDAEDDFGVSQVSDFFVEVGAGGDEGEAVEDEAAGGDEFVVAVEYLSDDDESAGNEGYGEVDDDAVCGGCPEGGAVFFRLSAGEDESGDEGGAEDEYGDGGEREEELGGFSDDVVVGSVSVVGDGHVVGEVEGGGGADEGVDSGEDAGEAAEGNEF